MTLTCSLCQSAFTSLIIGNDSNALNEISEAFIKHLAETHRTEAKATASKLTGIVGILPWLLAMTLATWQEPFIDTQLDMWTKKMMKDLGLEPKVEEKI